MNHVVCGSRNGWKVYSRCRFYWSPANQRLPSAWALCHVTHDAARRRQLAPTLQRQLLPLRQLHATAACWQPEQQQQQQQQQSASKAVATRPASLGARLWHEVLHYWNGFKLLAYETRIAVRIGLKYLRGKRISRRERRHLVRTVADLFRMLPFLFFVVIPFMELLLPFYLKFMPFMLPSTFKETDKEAEKLRIRLKAKLETAKFLQETLYEGFQLKQQAGSQAKESMADFRKFVQKCVTAGRYATTDELLRFSRLFADELTLDNLDRPQLAAICKLLDMAAVGPKAVIVMQLEIRLRQLHADDQLIQEEGVEKLNVAELQAACRSRGMRSLGLSQDRLRQQLQQWLEMHLHRQVPTSLLLLSRSLHFPEALDAEEKLRKAIGSLPQEAFAFVEADSSSADAKSRLEALKQRDRAIRQESREALAAEPPPLYGDARGFDISADDLQQLESAIDEVSAKALDEEEIRELKEELSEYMSGLVDMSMVQGGAERKQLSKRGRRAADLLSSKVDDLIQEMDGMFDKVYSEKEALERRIHEAKAIVEGREPTKQEERELMQQIETETEQVLSMNDLLLVLRRFQKMPEDDKWERILQVLDEDHDGKIELHHVAKVIELLGSENLRLGCLDLAKLLETLDKEKLLSVRSKAQQQQKQQQQHQQQQQQQQL